MRVTDVCTRLEDAVCVAALYRLHPAHAVSAAPRQPDLAHLSAVPARRRTAGARSATASRARLFDLGKGELVPFRDLVEELLAMLREDAEALGCPAEIEHARVILARGTSADRQVAHFAERLKAGASRQQALAERRRSPDQGNRGLRALRRVGRTGRGLRVAVAGRPCSGRPGFVPTRGSGGRPSGGSAYPDCL